MVITTDTEIEDSISAVGYVSPNATKVWIKFQFLNSSGAINNVKLTIDVVNYTLTFVAGTFKKTIPWRKVFYSRVGRPRIDFDIWFSSKTYSFYANVVDTNFTLPFKATGELITKYFGGKWEYIFGDTEIGFSRSPSKKLSCNENVKFDGSLNITDISDRFNGTNTTILLPMIGDFETKSFEFRKSLCPGSDLFRFQISAVEYPDAITKMHSNLWIRKNLQWFQQYGSDIFISGKKNNCSNIEMKISKQLLLFYCDKNMLQFISFTSLARKRFNFSPNDTKYLVYENEEKFICLQ
uniref:Uncharacterized protein n=1 Tax=Panagrolaimus superbus TaxID=310955 RepID=A0A914Y671_9BILA